jgi:uncharacterized protein
MFFLEDPIHKKAGYVVSILQLLFVILGCLFLSNFLAFAVAMPFVNFDLGLLSELVANPFDRPEYRSVLMLVQAVAAFGTFLASTMLFLKWIDKTATPASIDFRTRFPMEWIALTVLIMLVFMPANAWLVKWNEAVVLPEWLSTFETWAKEKEEHLKKYTLYLVKFEDGFDFAVGLLVVAVLPGIGEELLFRGVLQHKFKQLFGSLDVSIWFTGFLFSAIHFQFYGLFPRMLLGVLFGYLYAWSGHLLVPIAAHFFNNALALLLMYLYQSGDIALDPTTSEAEIPIQMAAVSLLIGLVLMQVFKRISRKKEVEQAAEE